jgi:hypothetical protein
VHERTEGVFTEVAEGIDAAMSYNAESEEEGVSRVNENGDGEAKGISCTAQEIVGSEAARFGDAEEDDRTGAADAGGETMLSRDAEEDERTGAADAGGETARCGETEEDDRTGAADAGGETARCGEREGNARTGAADAGGETVLSRDAEEDERTGAVDAGGEAARSGVAEGNARTGTADAGGETVLSRDAEEDERSGAAHAGGEAARCGEVKENEQIGSVDAGGKVTRCGEAGEDGRTGAADAGGEPMRMAFGIAGGDTAQSINGKTDLAKDDITERRDRNRETELRLRAERYAARAVQSEARAVAALMGVLEGRLDDVVKLCDLSGIHPDEEDARVRIAGTVRDALSRVPGLGGGVGTGLRGYRAKARRDAFERGFLGT